MRLQLYLAGDGEALERRRRDHKHLRTYAWVNQDFEQALLPHQPHGSGIEGQNNPRFASKAPTTRQRVRNSKSPQCSRLSACNVLSGIDARVSLQNTRIHKSEPGHLPPSARRLPLGGSWTTAGIPALTENTENETRREKTSKRTRAEQSNSVVRKAYREDDVGPGIGKGRGNVRKQRVGQKLSKEHLCHWRFGRLHLRCQNERALKIQ